MTLVALRATPVAGRAVGRLAEVDLAVDLERPLAVADVDPAGDAAGHGLRDVGVADPLEAGLDQGVVLEDAAGSGLDADVLALARHPSVNARDRPRSSGCGPRWRRCPGRWRRRPRRRAGSSSGQQPVGGDEVGDRLHVDAGVDRSGRRRRPGRMSTVVERAGRAGGRRDRSRTRSARAPFVAAGGEVDGDLGAGSRSMPAVEVRSVDVAAVLEPRSGCGRSIREVDVDLARVAWARVICWLASRRCRR